MLLPPAHQINNSVSVTTAVAWTQASNRHSGFAISNKRTGRSRRSAAIAIAEAINVRLLTSDF